jgi:hypothetical protein
MACFGSHLEIQELVRGMKCLEFGVEDACQEIRRIVELQPEIKAELCDAVSLSDDQIRGLWNNMRDDSAGRGTYMHQQFEYYLNGGVVDLRCIEMKLLLKFLSTLDGWAVYRTEWMIYGTDEWLGGSIDCAAIDAKGTILLIDWKRSRGLAQKYHGYGNFMQPPLQHIPDCAGWHYRLQLNCYKYILEKYYDCVVSQMYVVCTHPEHCEFPYIDRVEPLASETEAVMSEQRSLAATYLQSLSVGTGS